MKRLVLLLFASLLMQGIWGRSNDTIRVLAIGNSFSQDAVEQYLWELGHAAGVEMIIGNMYIGGCTLERHAGNIRTGSTDYAYRKVVNGIKTNTPDFTLEQALADETWDYVSVQQASGYSGIYDSFHPYIDTLLLFLRAHVKDDCRMLFHQTWAYQSDSQHDHFAWYNTSQQQMYRAIMDAEKQVMHDCHIRTVVPCGTAVQNARKSKLIGDHMTRDGYHLDWVYGRYTAACTWFEVLTHKSVVNNSYAPDGMSAELIRATQSAAHKAVKHPWRCK